MADDLVPILSKVPLFAGLDNRHLKSLARTLKERTFESGTSLVTEGAGAAGFWVVLEGSAIVTVGGEERRRLGPGDWYGEIALLDSGPRSASIEADGPVRAAGVSPWEFKALVDSENSIAWALLQTLAQRLRERDASDAPSA